MKGAIIGDIIGSAFNNQRQPSPDFQLFKERSEFTDDTILTIATADSLLNNINYKDSLIKWVKAYPDAGYQEEFLTWIKNGGTEDYISKGNGAARRISPIGFSAKSINQALTEAKKTTIITHNISQRIEASQAAAVAIFMANNGATKKEIKNYISVHFGYELNLKVSDWQDLLEGKDKPDTPVPPAMAAFFESSDFEEAIRLAITIGGPSDTIASITGALAQAYFKHIPKAFIKRALARLTPDMEMIIDKFEETYIIKKENGAYHYFTK
ncbi:ADP-ribosylglycohydrolase family protein [Marinilabiliaceae bacterium ANBcel2]|nr:ADP-ribosylglycohydrolase family protein [Marinilabiliaceae bacterium ANBcel2]